MIMPDDPELGGSPQSAITAHDDSASRIGAFIASPVYCLAEGSPADVLARRIAQLAPHLRVSAYDSGTAFDAICPAKDLADGKPAISFEFDLNPPDDIYSFQFDQWRLTVCTGGITVVFVLPCRCLTADLDRVVAALQAIRALLHDPGPVDPATLSPVLAN